MRIQYKSELHTKPVPRDTKAKWLKKDTDKVALVMDFTVLVDGIAITVPKGYITDGSSIPRIFWRIYNPWYTEARRGSCVHDYIYSHLHIIFSKDFADAALREMMILDGASEFTAYAFYKAVKWFGKGGWT